MLKKQILAKTLLATLIAGVSLSATQAAELVIQKYNDVAYLSGGIGDQEQAALKNVKDDFNLNLVFAVREGGNYLSDVNVRVYDDEGNLTLDAISKGPLFYASLPAGQYKVEVSGFGENYQQEVDVNESEQSALIFTWPRKESMM